MPEHFKQCLTVKEVAQILGVSVPSIWRYAKSGQIPAPIKFGNSTRWRASEISEWIEAQQAA